MRNQMKEDIGSNVGDDLMMDKALAALRNQNEQLISILGCLVESVSSDMLNKPISEQLAEDIKNANDILAKIEKQPLY